MSIDHAAFRAGDELILVVDNAGEREEWSATADDLAKLLQNIHYGADVKLVEVRAFTIDFASEPVEWTVDGVGTYDASDYAYPLVTIRMPDGSVREASYVIDGRA